MPVIALALSLAVLVSACADGDRREEKTERIRAKKREGPIVGIIVAAAVDKQGNPIEPSFTFSPSVRRMR